LLAGNLQELSAERGSDCQLSGNFRQRFGTLVEHGQNLAPQGGLRGYRYEYLMLQPRILGDISEYVTSRL
jgi:hypothetical protein